MNTPKQKVENLLKRLPENCSLEDIQYHIYVLQKIEKGLKQAKEGQVYTHEEAKRMMSK